MSEAKEHRIDTGSPEERVKAKWPDAEADGDEGHVAIFVGMWQVSDWRPTELQAWESAASRLETSRPITTTAPVEKCPECGCTAATIFASKGPVIMHEIDCSIALGAIRIREQSKGHTMNNPIPADAVRDLQDQLKGCFIASRNYQEGVDYGNSIPSGFGDAFKQVLRCRRALDAEIAGKP